MNFLIDILNAVMAFTFFGGMVLLLVTEFVQGMSHGND